MELLQEIKQLILPKLNDRNLQLYDICWTQYGNHKVLQIAIMEEDGSMDLDTCAEVSEMVSDILDEKDLIQFQYDLEVCSPGAEREIKSFDEIPNLVGKTIFVRLDHSIKGKNEFTGDILSLSEDGFVMNYRDKAATRQLEVKYNEIEFIRMAVKL